MKITLALVLLGAVIAAVHADSFDDQFRQILKECNEIEATRLDKADLDKIGKHDSSADADQVGAHLLCINQKFGIVDKNGDLVLEKAKEFLVRAVDNEENVETITKNCLTKPKGASPGAFSLHMVTCSKKYDTFSKMD